MDLREIRDRSGNLLALLVSGELDGQAVKFVTDSDHPMQLAVMNRPVGERIARHIHPGFSRTVETTSEMLFVKSGTLIAEIYSEEMEKVCDLKLGPSDLLLQFRGGHGFVITEECKLIEVKQGPYAQESDKTYF